MRRALKVHASKLGLVALILGVAFTAWLAIGAPFYMG
jgi:hypothetical protein